MTAGVRKDRIQQIIALCIKNDITPSQSTCSGFVRKICSARFALGKDTARSYTETVFSAWKADHWKFLVTGNPYLTEEEIEKWPKTHLAV